MNPPAASVLLNEPILVIEKQWKLTGILNFRKKLRIFHPDGYEIAYIMLKSRNELTRFGKKFIDNLIPLNFCVYDRFDNHVLTLRRPVAAFTSTTEVLSEDGMLLGSIDENYGPFQRKYRLTTFSTSGKLDNSKPIEHRFGNIREFFTAERFEVSGSPDEGTIAEITLNNIGVKKLRHHRNYTLTITGDWATLTYAQRATLLGAAFAIDLDYFSRPRFNNQTVGLPGSNLISQRRYR